MSTCAIVRSFIESKTTEVQTSNVGFTSEVSDYLVVHTGPGFLNLGQPLKLSLGVTHPLCFGLQIVVLGVSWVALLSLFLWVPGQGLIYMWCRSLVFRRGEGGRVGLSNPSPASLKDLTWLFLGLFQEFSHADGVRPLDLKGKATVVINYWFVTLCDLEWFLSLIAMLVVWE